MNNTEFLELTCQLAEQLVINRLGDGDRTYMAMGNGDVCYTDEAQLAFEEELGWVETVLRSYGIEGTE